MKRTGRTADVKTTHETRAARVEPIRIDGRKLVKAAHLDEIGPLRNLNFAALFQKFGDFDDRLGLIDVFEARWLAHYVLYLQ